MRYCTAASIVRDAAGDRTEVDTSAFRRDGRVSKMRIIAADKNGGEVFRRIAEVSDGVTVDTKGAAKIEIAPIYTYSDWYDVKSYDDFQPDVRYAAAVRKAAKDTGAALVDLSALSYKFYSETYGTDEDAKKAIDATYLLGTNIDGGLHLNYLGAIKCAEIVVQTLYDLKILGCVNKNYRFRYTDARGEPFTLRIKDSAAV